MKWTTKVLAGAVTLGGGFLQRQDVQDAIIAFAKAHPHAVWGSVVVALLGALLHNPNATPATVQAIQKPQ